MDLIEHRENIPWLLIIEFALFVIGAVFVTNMHPYWCQQFVGLLFWSMIVTALVYYFGVTRVR